MGDYAKKIISCCRSGANLIKGYEAALIGVSDNMLPIYDYWKLVEITQEREHIPSSDAASRYVDNNIIRCLSSNKANGPIIAYGPSTQGNKSKVDSDG